MARSQLSRCFPRGFLLYRHRETLTPACRSAISPISHTASSPQTNRSLKSQVIRAASPQTSRCWRECLEDALLQAWLCEWFHFEADFFSGLIQWMAASECRSLF